MVFIALIYILQYNMMVKWKILKKIKDILNTATSMIISYLPKVKSLTIKDNSDFEITFPNIPNDNQNII